MKIEHLSSKHDRVSFSCGILVLDSYLKERATQDVKRRMCAVHVLAEGKKIIGFYTLSAFTIQMTDLPPTSAKKYPSNLLLPCWLIGRLAVDKHYQNKSIGRWLLGHALQNILALSKQAGGYAAVVDAKDEAIKAFYVKYGFFPVQENDRRLILPLNEFPR